MWRGFEASLLSYAITICCEWISRDYVDNMAPDFIAQYLCFDDPTVHPPWLGFEPFHRAHRSKLLRKMPDHYMLHFEPDLPDDLDYIWPDSGATS